MGSCPPLDDVDAVAVCLLHADLDRCPRARGGRRRCAPAGIDVVCSHEVSPEFREYERMVTTVADAALRPVCSRVPRAAGDAADEVLVMTSAGGLVPARRRGRAPGALLLSGPAAGVRAAAAVAVGVRPRRRGRVRHGRDQHRRVPGPGRRAGADRRRARSAGSRSGCPSLAIHTIGAGGGSIARLDAGGALVVGPESAGADPGPACYGRGGTAATVTDANLVLGRIPADAELPGLGRLDVDAARARVRSAPG